VVDSITPEDFKRLYVDMRKPVLIKNVTAGWTAEHKWRTKSSLAAAYPETTQFRVGYGHDPMHGGLQMSLATYLSHTAENKSVVGDRPAYLTDNGLQEARFDVLSDKRASHPLEHTELPQVLDSLPEETQVIGMHFTAGGACTGTHIHYHSHAWCALIHGRKWWGVADSESPFEPPDELEAGFDYHPRDYMTHIKMDASSDWWEHRYPHFHECVQGPGDFIYIPDRYHHVVLNLWPSIGVAHEFVLPGQVARPQSKSSDEL